MGKIKIAATAVGKVAHEAVELDRKVTHAVAVSRDTRPMKLVALLAEGADQPQLITASIGTVVAGLVAKRPDLVRGGARMLASHLVATGIKTAVKRQIDHTRPKQAMDEGADRFEAGQSHDHKQNSFPSGHTAGAVAVARAASHEIDGIALPATIATGAIAAVQAPTGSHYLIDVMAGGAIGWVAEALVGAVFDWVEPAIEQRLRRGTTSD